MPSRKVDNRVHKRLIVQLQKYREVPKDVPEKNLNKSDSSDYGYSDHEDQDRNHDRPPGGKVSPGDTRDLPSCDQVTTEDIKNFILASYRSLSKQITNLSDQVEDISSRLSTLESLVKNVRKSEEKVDEKSCEEIVKGEEEEEKVRVTRSNQNKNKDKDNEDDVIVITIDDSDSKSEADADNNNSKEKDKVPIKALDTSVRLKFPLETENDFYVFNAKLTQRGYRNRVVHNLVSLETSRREVQRIVKKMIRYYLSKNVAVRYNTKVSTDKKNAFIDTIFYECIAEAIATIFVTKTVSDERLHGAITAALKSARNWRDNRKK